MTSEQRPIIQSLLLALGAVTKPDQIDFIWGTLVAACRQAGITLSNKPTTIPQAKSMANTLKSRILG